MSKLEQIFQKRNFIVYTSILLICCMIIYYINYLRNHTIKTISLPMLTIEDFHEDFEQEIYFAYDISEIYNSNPWKSEWNISELPVFYNTCYKNYNAADTYKQKINIMKQKIMSAQKIAQNFSTAKLYKIIYGAEQGSIENEELLLSVNTHNDVITVVFKNAISLPFMIEQQNKEQLEKIIYYFIDTYKYALHWQEGKEALSFQYNTDGIGYFELMAYENGDTLEKQFLNYYFNTVSIILNSQNEIASFVITKTDMSDKIENYPIITEEQAQKLLYQKKYISTSEYDFSENMPIVKTELVYKATSYDSIFMPYYKFFVQIPGTEQNGLHCYITYYVPAIKEQYLKNFDSL
ncbi:hypothetical protein AAK894_01600 [Lachnospiraceae bacterium 46-61]